MSNAPEIRLDELAADLTTEPIPPVGATLQALHEARTPASLDAAERAAIAHAIRLHHGNLTAAAKSLCVSRSTLYRTLERYRLQV